MAAQPGTLEALAGKWRRKCSSSNTTAAARGGTGFGGQRRPRMRMEHSANAINTSGLQPML
eukprot:212420-Chlamydomonas_euryale.AAC.1